MIEGACHCGAVRMQVATLPESLNDCQCNHCQKRGTLWAYFPKGEVTVVGETTTYLTGPRRIAFHFCPTCGCTTHWTPVDPKRDRVGVNARLLDRAALAGVPIRQSPGPR